MHERRPRKDVGAARQKEPEHRQKKKKKSLHTYFFFLRTPPPLLPLLQPSAAVKALSGMRYSSIRNLRLPPALRQKQQVSASGSIRNVSVSGVDVMEVTGLCVLQINDTCWAGGF